MKAVVFTEYGTPDVLQLKEVDTPTPKENEVLIKVHATTVEMTDAIFRGGNDLMARLATGLFKPKFSTPGESLPGKS